MEQKAKTLKLTPSNSANHNDKQRYVSYHCGEEPDSNAEELKTLLQYAKEDGFDLKADNDKGTKAKEGRAVKRYMRAAIANFISDREALNKPQEAPKTPKR